MTFKAGQWVVVDTEAPYWPKLSKHKKGPFRISHIKVGSQGKYAILEKAPNNAYFQHLTLYTPQKGDKVKVLKPMNSYTEGGDLPNTVGQVVTISHMYTTMAGAKRIRLDQYWYMDEEGVYELVEPKGTVNAPVQAPDAVKPQPTKRVLNA